MKSAIEICALDYWRVDGLLKDVIDELFRDTSLSQELVAAVGWAMLIANP
jgi:hypothetical protein